MGGKGTKQNGDGRPPVVLYREWNSRLARLLATGIKLKISWQRYLNHGIALFTRVLISASNKMK
jgi:hypothetical protein